MTGSPAAVDALASCSRILVVGPSGAGKTFLTRRLADLLGLPPVHLDACFWRPGWVSTPQHEWRQMVNDLVQAPRWIMDGTYESTLEVRIVAADAIVVIERARATCLWGILRRAMIHGNGPRPDAPPGQPIDRAFLRYLWQYPTRTRPVLTQLLAEHGGHKAVLILQGAKDVDALLAQMRARRQFSAGPPPASRWQSGQGA